MRHTVVLAGFGGQGLLLAGKLLAYAGMEEGRQVCWLPSYGPEMRGGTANCTVILSDERIGSPVVDRPDAVVAMNRPSFRKFGPRVREGGVLVVNSTLVPDPPERDDLENLWVPATAMAVELGNAKVANLIILGAYLGRTGVVSRSAVLSAVSAQFGGKTEMVELNGKALEWGIVRAAEVSHVG